ncbi:MAG: Ribonuclease 3 [bacterium]|nr:Ribonuclease 3 [bacterium]
MAKPVAPHPLQFSADWHASLLVLLARWGITPKNIRHYQRAFTHSSAVDNQAESYELYEFMGDAMIDVVVIEELVRRYPQELVGALAKAKSQAVSMHELARLSQELQLEGLLQLDLRGHGRTRGISEGIQADIYESLVGAVYLDRGYAAAKRVLKDTLRGVLQVDLEARQAEDFKSRLQERVQSLFKEVPTYEVVTTSGPDHEKTFRVVASFRGVPLAQGRGRSKKEAEQDSARKTLAQFQRYFVAFLPAATE